MCYPLISIEVWVSWERSVGEDKIEEVLQRDRVS